MGNDADVNATATGGIAIGALADTDGANAIGIGVATNADGAQAISIGFGSDATVTNAIGIGNGATTEEVNAVGIGTSADADGANSVAIGTNAFAAGSGDTAVGQNASVQAGNGSAFGAGATVITGHTNSTALGAGATTTRADQVMLGTGSNTYTTPGISLRTRARPRRALRPISSRPMGAAILRAIPPLSLALLRQLIWRALQRKAMCRACSPKSMASGDAIRELTEGIATVASLAQPILLPGQHFAMRAGWGGYDDANAVSFTAAGVVARDLMRQGSDTPRRRRCRVRHLPRGSRGSGWRQLWLVEKRGLPFEPQLFARGPRRRWVYPN